MEQLAKGMGASMGGFCWAYSDTGGYVIVGVTDNVGATAVYFTINPCVSVTVETPPPTAGTCSQAVADPTCRISAHRGRLGGLSARLCWSL